MKVEIKDDFYYIRILIEDIPHIVIVKSEFVGFNSWNDDDFSYSIEFITKTNSFVVEYDSKDKWLMVLQELNKFC